MTDVNQHLKLLGCKATDRITGWSGAVTSISFDISGCVQAAVTPSAVTKEGKDRTGEELHGRWFDVSRLEMGDRLMASPHFVDDTGAAEKPNAMPS
jgi:hypothetical protein